MRQDGKVIGATGGAVGLGALAAFIGGCCVAPWAVSLLGVTGAVAVARLAFLQPYLVVGMLGLLALAFWFAYRPVAAGADTACDPARTRRLRWFVWIATLIAAVIVVLSFAPRFIV